MNGQTATSGALGAEPNKSTRHRPIPTWAQIVTLVAIYPIIKFGLAVPFAGQVYMLVATLLATWFVYQDGQTWRDLGLRWSRRPADNTKGAAMGS